MDNQRQRQLESYHEAVDYIDRRIVRLTPRRRSPEDKVAAALGFYRDLGDPQRAFPSIQVAGTSGKGSVAQLLAESLHAAGLATGCHLSPYLQAFTEKSWVDGLYCPVERLVAAVDEVRPVAEHYRDDDDCPASVHGMASLAASFVAFRDSDLDVAVIETGLGGRYDLVQGLRRELCVITELGLDHTESLGPTLDEIAGHKAGIMEPGVPCVAVQGPGWSVLEAEAERVGAHLLPIRLDSVRPANDGTLVLDLEVLGTVELKLGTRAPFVARNVAIAATALDALARAGRPVRGEHLQQAVARRAPGRFEAMSGAGSGGQSSEPPVVLDCAHNAQKMAALSAALESSDRGRRLTLVFAASGARAPDELLRPIAGRVAHLVATELELYGKRTVAATEVAAAADRLGIDTAVEPVPELALARALDSVEPGRAVVVTGSVYLVGRLRDRWFPTEEVILQRTSWPSQA